MADADVIKQVFHTLQLAYTECIRTGILLVAVQCNV